MEICVIAVEVNLYVLVKIENVVGLELLFEVNVFINEEQKSPWHVLANEVVVLE